MKKTFFSLLVNKYVLFISQKVPVL
eukprot:UN19688